MKKVLITGANGFVGHYITNQLLGKGYTVIATGKGKCRLSFTSPDFSYYSLDYTDKQSVALFFLQINPAILVHCGAISSPDECEQNKEAAFLNNVTGTIYLLQEAEKIKSHFIFLSTDFVFNGDNGLYKEDDERSPVNYYGETKMMAEDEVMIYAGDWSIVRTVLVYGKSFSGRENIVTNSAKALQQGEPLKIFDDQVRTPTYVEDLAAGVAAIIEKRKKGIYHISGSDMLTLYQVVVKTAQLLHLDSSLITPVKEKDISLPVKRPAKTGLNISKANKELDFKPLTFEKGLRKTFGE